MNQPKNTENTFPYEDIVGLPHHSSPKHSRMSLYERAAQFAPFVALSGHEETLAETASQVNVDTGPGVPYTCEP